MCNFTELMPADFYVFDSKKDGERKDVNGYYIDGTIYIGISTETFGENTVLFTLSHELVHYIKDWSPAKFSVLAEFLFNEYAENGVDVQQLIDNKVEELKEIPDYKDISAAQLRDIAYEEIVADACQRMLLDSNVVERLAKLKKRDSNLYNKVKEFIKSFCQKIMGRYKTLKPQSLAAKHVDEIPNLAQKLSSLFEDALVDAVETHRIIGEHKITADSGVKYELKKYTEHQINNWSNSKKIVVYKNDAQLSAFIDNAIKGNNLHQKMYFGIIGEELSNRIKKDTSVDVKGFNVALKASEVRKILLYSHGDAQKEALRGQREVTKEDLIMIPMIITEPEYIRDAGFTYDNKPAISFEKTVKGKTTVITYVSDKHMDLYAQTMYAGKEKSLPTTADVKSSALTSETDSGTASINSISHDTVDVNKKSVGEVHQKEIGEHKNTADSGVRYSYAGQKAAKKPSVLQEAIEMETKGVDSETIRQKTGWFKSYDGMWRFEIDDSEFEVHFDGLSKNPDYLLYTVLYSKFVKHEMSEKEFRKLKALRRAGMAKVIDPAPLSNMIVHKKLFEAYPQLKDVTFSFNNLDENQRGGYLPDENRIVLSYELIGNESQIKKTLIHEIQHVIQYIEGFANGASIEYWEMQRQDIVETLSGARANLDLWLEDIGYPAFVKSSMQDVVSKKKTLEQHWKDCQTFKDNSKYAKQISNCEAEIAEFQKQYDEITHGMTASEQYFNTAGEIESRDASGRIDMTEEQRKNTRPDIDREDVMFADNLNDSLSYAGKNEAPVTYNDNGDIIPLPERFDSSKKDIRYQPKKHGDDFAINTDYSDLSKLDDRSRKVYNDRGWARDLLTSEDWVLYNEHIGYKVPENSRYVKQVLSDGTLILDINNKILLVSGKYGSDRIDGVLTFNAKSEADVELYKEDMYAYADDYRLNKESYGERCRIAQDVYGEKCVRYFDSSDYSYQKGQYDTGDRATLPDYWQNYGYTTGKQNGRGVPRETQGGVPRTVLKKYQTNKSGKNASWDNVSRANKKGELVNGFYYSLSNSEWRGFYNNLAEDGWLHEAYVGAIAPVRVGNKLIVAERKTRGKDAHDFVVDEVFMVTSDNDIDEVFDLVSNIVQKRGGEYDKAEIARLVNDFLGYYDGNAIFSAYDRSSGRFITDFAPRGFGGVPEQISRNSREEVAREGVSSGDKQDLQRGKRNRVKPQHKSLESLSDTELMAKYLEENSEAVKTVLRKTAMVEMNPVTLTRVVKRVLRQYGISESGMSRVADIMPSVLEAAKHENITGTDIVADLTDEIAKAIDATAYTRDYNTAERQAVVDALKSFDGRVYVTAEQEAQITI